VEGFIEGRGVCDRELGERMYISKAVRKVPSLQHWIS
jgi:hypothetical protein